MQVILDSYNTGWSAHSDEIAPDADVQLSQEQINGFKVGNNSLVVFHGKFYRKSHH